MSRAEAVVPDGGRDGSSAPGASFFSVPLSTLGDPVAERIRADADREQRSINLIASASYSPLALRQAEGSHLVNKNASGWVGRRSVANCEDADAIERMAMERAQAIFGGEAVNVQALSATLANVAVLRAMLKPGDRLLAFGEMAGGHISHGTPGHLSGTGLDVSTFGVDGRDLIDLDDVRKTAKASRPRMIVAGATSYPRRIDFEGLRRIADETGALLFADIAHVAGLIAAGLHPNPVPISDVATSSTQKTLCGPRNGGFTFSRRAHARAIDEAIYPGMQGPAPVHIIAARAVQLELVRRPDFKTLMMQVLANATSLCDGLSEAQAALYTGGTDTHLVVADVRSTPWMPKDLIATFGAYGVLANAVGLPPLPGDRRGVGLRVGTVAMTIRGFSRSEFHELGVLIGRILRSGPGAPLDETIRRRLLTRAVAHPVPSFLSQET
jgi:glycine hydroxymethyltransferase